MEGKFGSVAKWEITSDGKAKLISETNALVEASVSIDIVELIKLAATKSDNKVDDVIADVIAKAFGR